VAGAEQRLDILGKARSPVAGAGVEKVRADARIAADTVAHPFDVGADDDAVGAHEVLDRGAFLEKLRVADDGKVHADTPFRQHLLHRRAHPVGGADRHRALVDDHLVVGTAACLRRTS
jgi:hypothetical protein